MMTTQFHTVPVQCARHPPARCRWPREKQAVLMEACQAISLLLVIAPWITHVESVLSIPSWITYTIATLHMSDHGAV